MARQGGMFTNCTVSLLKDCKVTMVGIECDDANSECHFKKVHTSIKENIFF